MKIYKALINANVAALLVMLTMFTPLYAATESRQFDDHGIASLMLLVDGNEMQLAFQSAAHNVVGFKHKASTAEQHAEITAAIAVFNRADWFSFNSDANCELVLAEANTDLLDAKFYRGDADFYANYQLLCQQPAKLKQLQLQLFNLLPALQQVNVQWTINGQQGAAGATLSNAIIRF